jgi:hypothetical protein
LQEQQCGFAGLHVGWEVGLDARLLLAAEGRVGEDHVHALVVADFADAPLERLPVAMALMPWMSSLRASVRLKLASLKLTSG